MLDAGSLQTEFDNVLAVEREVVPNRDSAPRTEREVLAHALILREEVRDIVRLQIRKDIRISDGRAAHLPRRGHVAHQQHRRYGENVGTAVKTVAPIVDRKER